MAQLAVTIRDHPCSFPDWFNEIHCQSTYSVYYAKIDCESFRYYVGVIRIWDTFSATVFTPKFSSLSSYRYVNLGHLTSELLHQLFVARVTGLTILIKSSAGKQTDTW